MQETTNVEAVMNSIREHVLTKQTAVAAEAPMATWPAKAMASELHEHLHQATMGHDQINLQLDLTPANTPVIGGVLQTVRRKLHELVLFYVNQTAAKQINVNHHLLQAITILAEEVEKMTEETSQAE